jgi:hypothetical protein
MRLNARLIVGMRWRTKTSTVTLASGTKVKRTKLVAAPELEWRLQSEQIRQLRAMPEYGREFLLVGGMEAARRSPQEAVKAKATGLTAGHPDVTIFLRGGRCAFIENKGEKGRLSPAQVDRHTELRALGHAVEVVKCSTPDEAAAMAVDIVRGWLAANDNESRRAA